MSKLVTAADVDAAAAAGRPFLATPADAIITPQAKDRARELGLTVGPLKQSSGLSAGVTTEAATGGNGSSDGTARPAQPRPQRVAEKALTGAGLFAAAIERQGIKTVFGLCGHLDVIFGALVERGIRLIDQRHEAAVIHAADGYSRTTNGLAVAVVTAGPGLANAIGGLVSAWEACTPLLIITGRNPLSTLHIGQSQDSDHPRAVREMTKWAETVVDPSRLGEYVDDACRIALSGRPGPVLLDIPADIQYPEVSERVAEEALGPLRRLPLNYPDPEAIDRAAGLLAEAEHPVVLAGGGAYRAGAGEPLRRLANEFNLPVFGKGTGRGLVDEDMVVGFPWPLAQHTIKDADVVMVVGARFNSAIGFAAPPRFREDTRFIQIDIDGADVGRNRPIEVAIVADAAVATEAIADALAQKGFRGWGRPVWVNDGLRQVIDRVDELGHDEGGPVHPLRMARELATRLPEDAIIVGDGANCLNWYKAELKVHRPGSWLDHEPFGAMGIGVPMALGAVAAEQDAARQSGRAERPVFLVTGDGAFGFFPTELATSARHRLPFFTMIANDGGWGANRNSQRRSLGRNVGVDLDQNRYELLAEALGAHGELAETPAEVGPAIDRALAAVAGGRSAVVNVIVDPESGTARGDDPLLQMVSFNRDWPRTAAGS